MVGSEVIFAILANEDLKPGTFAKMIGVTTTQIYDLQSGKVKKISEKVAEKILDVFPQYSKAWLITGEGSMLTEDTIVPESKDIPYEMDELSAMKQTINELLEEKKLLKNENKTLHDTNARLSISIERLTELLYEKKQQNMLKNIF